MSKYIILIPSFNDWDCLNILIPKINQALKNINEDIGILIVNDGSTKNNNLSFKKFDSLKKVEVLNLKKNVKAQIAIATGLNYLKKENFDGGIIVMDADGQDDPEYLINIIEESKKNPKKTISINRTKREDDFSFIFLYKVYLILTFIFTFMKFGVYSYLHSSSIEKILSTDDVYMAYVAGLAKHFTNKSVIYAVRKKRIIGESQNNYKSLTFYALKIISVFRYQALINSIIFSIIGIVLFGSNILLIPYLLSLLFFNIIIFLIPYKIDKSFIKEPLTNIKSLENLIKI